MYDCVISLCSGLLAVSAKSSEVTTDFRTFDSWVTLCVVFNVYIKRVNVRERNYNIINNRRRI